MEILTYCIVIAIVAFIQNMSFTAVGRSRNSGDVRYHRFCAWASNGIWFICQVFIWKSIMPILLNPEWTFNGIIKLLITAGVYILATAEGSVVMMKILLKKEKGKRKVGGNDISEINIKIDDLKIIIEDINKKLKILKIDHENTLKRIRESEQRIGSLEHTYHLKDQ